MKEDCINFNTGARDALFDSPKEHHVPKYVDIVVTEDQSRFGLYFNNSFVIEGPNAANLLVGIKLVLCALQIKAFEHVSANTNGQPLAARLEDVALINPDEGVIANEQQSDL